MELVGSYLSIVENKEGIKMDFRCTNKEIFKDILVPPALRSFPNGLVRIFLHQKENTDPRSSSIQWVLNHCEELE